MMSKTAAEPLVRISKREGTTFVQKVLVRAIAILLALVVDAFFIFFVTGLNPISVYGVMWNGTFMNTTRFSWALRDLSSLLCIAIALAPAFKMRFWNIGGEGQVLIGGLVAALIMVYFGSSLPAPLLFAAMVIGSVLAGAIWAFVPAWFKSRWNTNETLFTLMMNYVATSIVDEYHARPGIQPGHPEQSHQGWLAARDQRPALHHQYYCGAGADLCDARLPQILQAGVRDQRCGRE